MEQIPFKAEDTIALWQWLVLIGFCVLLIIAAVAVRVLSQKGKAKKLLAGFNIQPLADELTDVQFQHRTLGKDAKLYYLNIKGKTHLIFETDKGLIELDHELPPHD